MHADSRSMTDSARRALNLLTCDETADLGREGVIVPDPNSSLVSRGVTFGHRVVLWPATVLRVVNGGSITVGPGTAIFPRTTIVATAGHIDIGAQAEIGEEGGFSIKAEEGISIAIGDGVRLLGGGSLALDNWIGRGAQILGPIRCQGCRLGDGDTYRDPDPDRRGGVLKGAGVARDVSVPQGRVIQSFSVFSEADLRPQSFFHPPSG